MRRSTPNSGPAARPRPSLASSRLNCGPTALHSASSNRVPSRLRAAECGSTSVHAVVPLGSHSRTVRRITVARLRSGRDPMIAADLLDLLAEIGLEAAGRSRGAAGRHGADVIARVSDYRLERARPASGTSAEHYQPHSRGRNV